MSLECEEKDWMIELGVRPNKMSPIDPPSINNNNNEDYSRLLSSMYAMTLGENLFSHNIDPYILEHIEMEKEFMEQDDLALVWSDDISLTLCFLASLAHHGDYSQDHLLKRYFQWWMNGYMCPAGHCFTPRVHLKKSIDLFGETQAAQALGIAVDMDRKTSKLIATPSSLLRLSPIGYFYCKHSYSKRLEITKDLVERMFGKKTSIDIFIEYIELLVNSLNGLSKENILKKINMKLNSNDLINKTFFDLIDLLSNDNNNIEQGIKYALEKIYSSNKECKYLNPFDSNETILLTLYLQISSAIYNTIPDNLFQQIYAKETIESLAKWIIYERNQNLHSI
ncbi:unnamed protein product [Adineta steineri]|uniref:Uncharacterized protein n=1 Tax=Adineta steineri TaxID=433720 RepID=A0A814TDB8_9BILA|nr:unnamed protein product [Adineta steineri]CAF1356082.1 unnamed protein product [Adineta steineri]